MISAAQVDRLVYEITSRFDSSVTPAEARALIATPDADRSIDWLLEVLSDVGIDHESIASIDQIDFSRFYGVGFFYNKSDKVYSFFFDEGRQTVLFKPLEGGVSQPYDLVVPNLKVSEGGKIYRFYEREAESFAVIPGIE